MLGRLPDSGLMLSGRTVKHCTSNDTVVTDTTSWELQPAGSELEVVAELAGYDTWIPEGNARDYTEPGNEINIRAVLQNKNHSPVKDKATTITFQMVEVSNEKGLCLNFPKRKLDAGDIPSPLDLDDLQFTAKRRRSGRNAWRSCQVR